MRVPPKHPLDALVEERIQDAMRRGEFDDLPSRGKPIELDDDSLVPEELRAAYRVLKNAGYVPPEVLERRAVGELEALLPRLPEGAERRRAIAKLAVLRTRLGGRRGERMTCDQHYAQRILEKLAGVAEDA